MNEEQREHFKELCAVWIDHLNQVISFHPADGFEQLPFATHEAQMHFALEKCKDGYQGTSESIPGRGRRIFSANPAV